MDSAGEFLLLVLTDLFCFAVCPNLTTLNETSGVITSPFYPRRYPNNQRCSWQITASKGKRVVLYIEYMDIQQCSCDHLEIEGGLSWDGFSAGRKCGFMRCLAYYSFRESLKLLFVSNGDKRWYRGFRETYTRVNHTGMLGFDNNNNNNNNNNK